MDLDLADRAAIVTGGSRGIGKATARALSEEGARVAILARGPEALQSAAKEIEDGTGGIVIPVVCDTGQDSGVRQAVAAVVEVFGGVDILINCAGQPGRLAPPPRLADITDEVFWSDTNVKVMGYLRCIREVTPYMVQKGGGRIVNVSGLGTRQSGSTVRSMRNAAVTAMTKNLADELGPQGIAITTVHPGTVRTEATPQAIANRAAREGTSVDVVERQLGSNYSLGRLPDAREVAWVIAFLASPRAVAVNGDVVVTSGGAVSWIHY
jgi:NAD(P)-dependent dehydrogenase (short-subunit alcohol dehydrogenase family)